MQRKVAITIMALAVGGFILTSPPASAEQAQQQQQKRVQGNSGGAKAMVPRSARTAAPHANIQRRALTQRTVTQRKVRTASPKAFTRKVHTATPKAITRKVRTATPKAVTPTVTSSIGGKKIAMVGSLRRAPAHGAGRAKIRGHNFSVWRNGYRVHHGGHWRTFVALGTLSAIMIDSDNYYPYAYLSASQPYCAGLTDGCQLRWQEVETIEGDVIDQCVAYCPWQ